MLTSIIKHDFNIISINLKSCLIIDVSSNMNANNNKYKDTSDQ